MNILFMCVANSARSQMAEGLAKSILGNAAWVESAGSEPKTVNPHAIAVMSEMGIDLSGHSSKSYDQLNPRFVENLRFIITLCAEEVCPVISSRTAEKLHWPFPDPATKEEISEQESLTRFRQVRDDLKNQIEKFKTEMKERRSLK